MTLAQAGPRGDAGVSVAKVNLKLIWDVVSRIKVGADGRSLCRRCLRPPHRPSGHQPGLAQHRFLRLGAGARSAHGCCRCAGTAKNIFGRPVLAAHAAIAPLGWRVFVEVPVAEAFAPLYSTLLATGIVLLGGLMLAVLGEPVPCPQTRSHPFKRWRPVRRGSEPGRSITGSRSRPATSCKRWATSSTAWPRDSRIIRDAGAQGRGANATAAARQSRQVAVLAAASHDLRQPLHALNLFVRSVARRCRRCRAGRLVAQIRNSVAAMNELFNALLDISKLDAGVLDAERWSNSRLRPCSSASRRRSWRGAREGTEAARTAKRRLGAQRPDPAGTHPAQSRFQRSQIHRARRRGRRLPAAR